MTQLPTEIMHAAAEKLETIARRTSEAPWSTNETCDSVHGADSYVVAAGFEVQADAQWVAMANPRLGPAMAQLLRQMAKHPDGMYAPDGWYAALELARRVLA